MGRFGRVRLKMVSLYFWRYYRKFEYGKVLWRNLQEACKKYFQSISALPQKILRKSKEENIPKVNNLAKPICLKVESSDQSKKAVKGLIQADLDGETKSTECMKLKSQSHLFSKTSVARYEPRGSR